VTGASSGAATARAFQASGYPIYAVARRLEPRQGLRGHGVHVFSMDLTDESMTAGVAKILDEAGRIDVLINNAGYGSYGSDEDVPLSEARRCDLRRHGLGARLIMIHCRTCTAHR
jgi:NADP-dependent 3-hydroxy acid dehydrogenase YdfG